LHCAHVESFPEVPCFEKGAGGKPQTFGIGVPKRIRRGEKKAHEI
jgi:hypothetical protein